MGRAQATRECCGGLRPADSPSCPAGPQGRRRHWTIAELRDLRGSVLNPWPPVVLRSSNSNPQNAFRLIDKTAAPSAISGRTRRWRA